MYLLEVIEVIRYIYSRLFRKLAGVAVKDSRVHSTAKIEAGSSFINSEIDRHSFLGYGCDVYRTNIGPFCSIANGVMIGAGEHPSNWVSTSPVFYEGRDSVKKKYSTYQRDAHSETIIGADVWIGHGVKVRRGVTIGVGAIIGMGAIVTRDVEPYSVVGGAPARFIRWRFDADVRNRLIESNWWTLDDRSLELLAENIRSPRMFLAQLEALKCE